MKADAATAALSVLLLLLLLLTCAPRRINSQPHRRVVNMNLVRNASSIGAYCLDGSLPAYHLDRGFGAGARNWLLQFEMSFIFVNVSYGGNWSDSNYQGGREIDIPLSRESISLYNLRCNITEMCNLFGTDYEIFYFKQSQFGRLTKSPLETNEQLLRLCGRESAPKLYVVSNTGTSSSYLAGEQAGASSSYFPTYEQSYQYGGSFQFDYHGGDWHAQLDEIGRRVAASSNWEDDVFVGDTNFALSSNPRFSTARESEIPDLNFPTSDEHHGHTEPQTEVDLDDDVDDDDDPEYDVEADADAENEVDEDGYTPDRRMNKSLFAEYTAWILEEGGMEKLLRLMYPSQHGDDEDIDTRPMSSWIVPVVPIHPNDSAVYIGDGNLILEGLEVDAIYDTKDDLQVAAGLWNLERRAQSATEKSDTIRLWLHCKSSKSCTFKLRATTQGGPWRVRKFCGDHTCREDITNLLKRKVRSKVIGAYFAKIIQRDTEIIKPKVIRNELRSVFGVDISYGVALRGRNCAIQIIYGSYEDSFNMLPGYLHMLKEANPGTITQLDIGNDGRFKHVFIALGATRVTYPICIRPVIVVDGTHLKGKNNGILFVAVAKDANEQLYPLAYGIGPTENHASWTFFMQGLRNAYGSLARTVIVSDQHISIIHAVKSVFPEAHHGLCYYHLSKNLAFYGKTVGKLFQKAAYTYDIKEFKKRMTQIHNAKPAAYNKLMEIGPEMWARRICPFSRFSNITSNAAESFNNTLLWARRLPICACLDAVRIVIERWFDERRADCRRVNHAITDEARNKIASVVELARTYSVRQCNAEEYTIRTARRSLTVNLQTSECDCMRWQLDCLPCAHAIAAIIDRKEEVVDYVSAYYKRTTYANSYNLPIMPVPQKSQWRLPHSLQNPHIDPPLKVRLPGRPRQRRHRGRGERVRGQRKCRYCQSTDHVSTMCPIWLEI